MSGGKPLTAPERRRLKGVAWMLWIGGMTWTEIRELAPSLGVSNRAIDLATASARDFDMRNFTPTIFDSDCGRWSAYRYGVDNWRRAQVRELRRSGSIAPPGPVNCWPTPAEWKAEAERQAWRELNAEAAALVAAVAPADTEGGWIP